MSVDFITVIKNLRNFFQKVFYATINSKILFDIRCEFINFVILRTTKLRYKFSITILMIQRPVEKTISLDWKYRSFVCWKKLRAPPFKKLIQSDWFSCANIHIFYISRGLILFCIISKVSKNVLNIGNVKNMNWFNIFRCPAVKMFLYHNFSQ